MATKYSKTNPNNPVANVLGLEAQLQQNILGKAALKLHFENYWLKDCYRPKRQEIIDYRPLQSAWKKKYKIWHRCQNWEFRFDPLLHDALKQHGAFHVSENHIDVLFPAKPVVVINFSNSDNRAIFKMLYPRCGF